MKSDSNTRGYKQTARAKAAEDTGNRVLDAFVAAFENGWFEEIRLEDIAKDAGVTVQTVIRRFGGKDGLLHAASDRMQEQILGSRRVPAGDVGAAIETIIAEYETRGDLVMRMLAQETRYAPVRELADRGRKTHRDWVEEVFAPWLSGLEGETLRKTHDQLVIALDIYIWKLLRLDMKRSKSDLREAMLSMCACAIGLDSRELEKHSTISLENSK